MHFHLNRLNLRKINFTSEKRKQIEDDALFAFATKEEMKLHNEEKLLKLHSPSRPVARIFAETTMSRPRTKHFDDSTNIPRICELCIGAKVQIRGINILPEWGLFNGSIGIVKDIVFSQSESPNNKQLPLYVLVHFKSYKGPAFLTTNPQYVPIAPISVSCQHGCCKRKQIPLVLAFARTIHTLQGVSIGPTKPNQPENAYNYIIVSVGPKFFESRWPGHSYVVLSRPTTIGSEMHPEESALFFTGNHAIPARFQNIHLIESKQTVAEKWAKRKRWIEHLQNNEITVKLTKKETMKVFDWYKDGRTISHLQLQNLISMTYATLCSTADSRL